NCLCRVSAAVFHDGPGQPHRALFLMRTEITLAELEQAIHHWRERRPSTGEERALSPEVNALAGIYALMIYNGQASIPAESVDQTALQLLESWRAQRGG